jgi:outer membrane receptor protein involved in Fe transport
MRRTLVWLWTTVVIPVASVAGQTWSSDGAPRSYALARQANYVPLETMRAGAARLPAVLTRRVTLHRESVLLQQALLDIANQAGLGLSYGEDVVRSHTLVSIDVTGERAADALAAVVDGTAWAVLVTAAGQVTVVPAKQVAGGTVVGRVADAKSGQPIAGASVAIAATRWRATTGEDGRYRLEEVAAGTYTLTVRRIGYVTSTVSVTVTADREATADVRLEVSVTPLDAVVVTGTVSPAQQKELSSPITVIPATEIERRGIRKINDLFRGEIPGIFSADYGDAAPTLGAPVYVRGTAELFDLPALKTYVDGVEIANSLFLNEIDPTMIDHVEIVRGPEASTLYGAQAINGVMQIFTKKGALGTAPHLTASFGVGSLESPYGTGLRHDHNVAVSGGTTDLSYNVGASYQHEGPWTPGYRRDVYSAYAGLTVQPAASPLRLDVTARIGQQNTSSGRPQELLRGMLDGTFNLDPPQAIPLTSSIALPQQTLGATLHYAARPNWQHTFTVGLDRGANGSNWVHEPSFATPGDSFMTVFSAQTARSTVAYNSALDLRLSDQVTANVIVGADHWYYQEDSYTDQATPNAVGSLGTDNGRILIDRERDHETGAFSQLRVGVRNALFLTAGVRVDQGPSFPADRHHRSTSPRIGASYVLDIGPVRAKLRAGYGSALKPADPGFKVARQFTPSYAQLASPNLLPERQTGWDGGVELYAGDNASLSVTRYDQRARDLIWVNFVAFVPVFEQQFVNVARVKNSGWELEGTVRLPAGLQAKATYSETQSIVEALAPDDQTGFSVGQPLPGVPHHSGALTLSQHTDRLSLEATGSYVGTSSNYNATALYSTLRLGSPIFGFVTLPAAYRLALRAAYDVTPRLTLWARCDNVTNHIVVDQGFFPVDQVGRTTIVGVRVR